MDEISVKSWGEFEIELAKIQQANKRQLVFRGLRDAKWTLSTTLERLTGAPCPVADYYSRIIAIKPEIEAFTASQWKAPKVLDVLKFSSVDTSFTQLLNGGKPLAYSYMVYLRHHGFPSPLLDWSVSPYVAAYFAFRKQSPARVAIYAFSERPDGIKMRSPDQPSIYAFGTPSRGNKRHFNQQSRYTVCVQRDTTHGWQYVPHKPSFNQADATSEPHQDVLYKISVPGTERKAALQHLMRYNLSAFSLFGSEESLMETLTMRDFGDLVG